MAEFHQEGQHVTTQYNADSMSFGPVQTKEDLVQELQRLRGEVDRAASAQALDRKTATEVRKAGSNTRTRSRTGVIVRMDIQNVATVMPAGDSG